MSSKAECLLTNSSGNCICKLVEGHKGLCKCSVCGDRFHGEPSSFTMKREQNRCAQRTTMVEQKVGLKQILEAFKNQPKQGDDESEYVHDLGEWLETTERLVKTFAEQLPVNFEQWMICLEIDHCHEICKRFNTPHFENLSKGQILQYFVETEILGITKTDEKFANRTSIKKDDHPYCAHLVLERDGEIWECSGCKRHFKLELRK